MSISAAKLEDFFKWFDPGNVSHSAAIELLHEAREGEVLENELIPIKRQMLRAEELKQRENIAWLSRLFKSHQRGEDPLDMLKRSKMIERLSVESLSRVAHRFLNLEHRLEMTLLPKR